MQTGMVTVLERARLMKMGEVCSFVGVGETTVKKMVKAGKLPAPVRLSSKCVRWRVGDLADWSSAGAGGQA